MHRDADQIIGLYRRHADAWMRRRGSQLVERKWLEKLLALMPAAPAILDIGCGSGQPIGRYLVARGCSVTGVDSSVELIDAARAHISEANWIVADMRTLHLGRRFDGLLAWNSSFHLTPDDQRRMFPVFRAHAAPGAALMFTSGPGSGQAIGQFEGEPLYHSSLDANEYRELLDACGFDVVEHVAGDPECGQQTVWLARLRNAR